MLTIHHLGISQSERIIWLCEELGIAYALKRYDRDSETRMAPADYKALHPMGIAPVITDGELVLGESGAIIEYIIAKYGEGRLSIGPENSEFAAYLYWFHAANGTVMPSGMIDMIAKMLDGAKPPVLQALRSRGEKAFALIEARLGIVPYFAGTFSAADIMMLFPLTTMRAFMPRDLSGFPNIRAYLKRIGDRPAYLHAMAAGDPGRPLILD